MSFSPEDERFRSELRTWVTEQLSGRFADIRHRGGPGDEHMFIDERKLWERCLGDAGWIGIAVPAELGGRGLTLSEQMIFHEEYARAGGPGRVGIVGEGLVAPTLVHFASPEQQQRFLPGILSGTEFWCQGYSEPDAGSDLANLSTRAELDGDEWVINGQKVWTSLAHISDWCFVLCRTDREAPRHRGISYLLIDMESDGIEIRPIRQITGHSEFSEVYYTDARTPADLIVGEVNGGWKVAMGTLAFERSTLTLGQQLEFLNQYEAIVEVAKTNGSITDPVIRQNLMEVWTQLQLMRWNTLRTLSVDENAELDREAMIGKLFWASLHRRMGELAVDIAGARSLTTEQEPGYEPNADQRLFLYTRADTIYGGSNEIQRNIIGERALGLPREPR